MQWLSFRNRHLEAMYLEQFAAAYFTMDMTVIVINLLLTVSWLGKYGRHGLPRFELFISPQPNHRLHLFGVEAPLAHNLLNLANNDCDACGSGLRSSPMLRSW